MNIIIVILLALGLGGGAYIATKSNTEVKTTAPVVEKKVVESTATSTVTNDVAPVATIAVAGEVKIKIGNYKLVTNESVIWWEASKPLISGYTHKGTIGVSAGTLVVTKSAFTGSFTIDMNAIKVVSLGGGKAGKESTLESHLKGDNFFASNKFPTGTFAIDSITAIANSDAYAVKGKLTLKGVTKPVEFPVVITQSASGKITAEGPVTINRTLWGITYGSGTFFDNVANNAIDDNIKLTLKLVAQ